MKYIMNLDNQYFLDTKYKLKKIEFRLNDLKRKKIKIGDTITFINRDYPNQFLDVVVTNLIYAKTFSDLLNKVDSTLFNYDFDELCNILNIIYSKNDISLFGVVAIQFEVI